MGPTIAAPDRGRYKPSMSDVLSPAALGRQRAERGALIALFLGATAIAFSPIFVRLSELGPSATAFWRVAFAVPALSLWLTTENRQPGAAVRQPRSRRDWAWLGL